MIDTREAAIKELHDSLPQLRIESEKAWKDALKLSSDDPHFKMACTFMYELETYRELYIQEKNTQ